MLVQQKHQDFLNLYPILSSNVKENIVFEQQMDTPDLDDDPRENDVTQTSMAARLVERETKLTLQDLCQHGGSKISCFKGIQALPKSHHGSSTF